MLKIRRAEEPKSRKAKEPESRRAGSRRVVVDSHPSSSVHLVPASPLDGTKAYPASSSVLALANPPHPSASAHLAPASLFLKGPRPLLHLICAVGGDVLLPLLL